MSHVIRTEDFDCGIMISASHNPYYDNGIKVMNGNGEKLEESVITEIEKYLDGEMEEIPLAKREISEERRILQREETAISVT